MLYLCILCSIAAGRNSSIILLRVLTVLEDVKETLRIHGSLLQFVLRKLSTDGDHPDLPDSVHFPLQSEAKFDEFEKRAGDTSLQKALVSFTKILIEIFNNVFVSKHK